MGMKSQIRINAEAALIKAGLDLSGRRVWIDHSGDGNVRIKFHCFEEEVDNKRIEDITHAFAPQYLNWPYTVTHVRAQHRMGYGGIAFKVFGLTRPWTKLLESYVIDSRINEYLKMR
ncbi:MAG: hypothetical protein DRJ15_13180 [Bacteroidetes bacterium]|nr:MAG: hypothetical protein DRJ15_13180 [Bacteroidota bacterium]